MSTIDYRRETKDLYSFSRILPWLAFVIYLVIASFTMMHHELWGDELHSWNMAKTSNTFLELMQNRRYEGHPPVWHIILWLITRFTHNPEYMQWVHLCIAAMAVYLVLFRSPLPLIIRILIPFGYYLLYEYAILSRNYMPGVLAGFLLCALLHKDFRYRLVIYYFLLLVMSYTHLLALILAGCIHLYFLLSAAELKKNRTIIVFHALMGSVIFASALYLIKPPPDSDLSIGSWIERWNTSQLIISIQAPLRAFVPLPAWWKYNFWNQQFLLDLNAQFKAFKIINPLLALALVVFGAYILKTDRKSLLLYLTNVAATFIAGNIYPLISQRYSGFIFIGFIVALWLHCYHKPLSISKKRMVSLLLVVQLTAGIFIVVKDISLPFSNAFNVKELLDKKPMDAAIVTDYWALSALSTYNDKPYYCVDLQKETSFILWGSDMMAMREKNINRYYDGISNYMRQRGLKEVYMISTSDSGILYKIDPKLFTAYKVDVMERREGAIEKWSNLYLYRISLK
ncbi:MAG: hypothetical protein WC756_11360 [Taibaiella sp.]|jgi:hypothetical protein